MSTVRQSLPPRREDQIAEESAPFFQGGRFLSMLEQTVFTEMLRLERHRSNRSGQPFLLLLIDFPGVRRRRSRSSFKRAARAIACCTRESDVVGWLERENQLGVLMTEIGAPSATNLETILARVNRSLAHVLEAEMYARLRIRLEIYPEQESDGEPEKGLPKMSRNSFARGKGLGWVSRAVDVFASLAALIVLAPLFAVIALLVKYTSRGPVFFRQTRLGQYGRTFTFLKFRTMYCNADPAIHEAYVAKLISGDLQGGPGKCAFKMQNDPRITPFGRFLRKSSLDELPQFVNVLRNEMSLVGPRPPLPYEYEKYKPWHRRRVLDLKPGITGLWQVEGRSRTTFEQMVRLDLRYGRFRSVWSDLGILIRTPVAVVKGRGAC